MEKILQKELSRKKNTDGTVTQWFEGSGDELASKANQLIDFMTGLTSGPHEALIVLTVVRESLMKQLGVDHVECSPNKPV